MSIPQKNQRHNQPSVPSPSDARAWLEACDPAHRSAIANWFHDAVRSGIPTPAAVLAAVESTIRRRLDWSPVSATDWRLDVLERLHSDRARAMAYAQHVLEYEALPYAARQKVKAERTFTALKEAMKDKTVTAPQRHYLQILGYAGPEPADRAEASQLIDTLRQERGQA